MKQIMKNMLAGSLCLLSCAMGNMDAACSAGKAQITKR